MKKTLIVTGAGSGVGRAIALRFAKDDWNVALIGRRLDPLLETAVMGGPTCMAFSCDVSKAKAVNDTVTGIIATFSRIDVLVNSAGINIPNRSWRDISVEDFRKVISINLLGAFHCIKICLPELKKSKGTIININSEAGKHATAKAGCAYVASKFGLAGLAESLNAEERLNGVRSISIFPGEINTSMLDQRPVPPPEQARLKMVQPEDVADCAWTAANLPPNALIEELVIRPTETDYQ